MVKLKEPAVLAFTDAKQLSSSGKVLRLSPTAPNHQAAFSVRSSGVQIYRQYLADRRSQVLSAMSSKVHRNLVPTHQWDMVGNGFAIQLSAAEAAQLRALPEVAQVDLDPGIRQPEHTPSLAAAAFTNAIPSKVVTRDGEGVVIGMIGSGITPTHPAFAETTADGYTHQNPRGRRFGLCVDSAAAARCNNKLIGMYDYVNETGAQGADAGKDLAGFGTAAASLAAGNPVAGSFSSGSGNVAVTHVGQAPRANLISYKIFGAPTWTGTFAGTMVAINQAVLDQVDVLQLNYFSPSNRNPWTATDEQALLMARQAGILVVTGVDPKVELDGLIAGPSQAPWVMAASYAVGETGSRSTLANIRGPGQATPLNLVGEGFSVAAADAELVYGADRATSGFRYCGAVNISPSNPTLPNNPFPAGSLQGKIVACEFYYFSVTEMAANAKAAGAVGIVVLNNNDFDFRHVTYQQNAVLPLVHLNQLDSERLRSAMTAARDQNGLLRAEILASREQPMAAARVLPYRTGDVASRVFDGVMKPNLVVPAANLFAADYRGGPYSYTQGRMSAASVAAGLAATLISQRPDWNLDQVVSALQLTAVDARLNSETSVLPPAGGSDAGSGIANAQTAMHAELYLPTSIEAFQAANPANGGVPAQLNLPSVYSRKCMDSCTFQRTVKANVAGTWRVQTQGQASMQLDVTPNQFTLQAGESVSLSIRAKMINRPKQGTILNGNVQFVNTSPSATTPQMDLPVVILPGAGDSVTKIDLAARPTVGETEIELPGLDTFDQVGVVQWPLAAPAEQSIVVASGARRSILVNKPASAGSQTEGRLVVNLNSATAPDLDLYVKRDLTGDGNFGNGELLCSSVSFSSTESCELVTDWSSDIPYVIEVVAFQASANGDNASLGIYNQVPSARSDLLVTPQLGRTARDQTLRLRASWDLKSIPANSNAMTYITLKDSVSNAKTVRVDLTRADTALPVRILSPINDQIDLALAAGQAHEQLFIDVPANMDSLVVRTENAPGTSSGNVDLYVSKLSQPVSPPNFPVAPQRSAQPFRSISNSNVETVALEGASLSPGRYFITPMNAGNVTARVRVNVQGTFAGMPVQPAANGYFNPARSGHGVFLAKTPAVWALAWYTFDAAGKPIWYTAQGAAATTGQAAWVAPLYRSTWNGSRDLPQAVGRVILSFDGSGSFTYSWELEGVTGSEPFQPIGTPLCANGNLSVGGGWLRPDQSGWGSYFLNFAGNFEAEAIYVYDNDGLPRWVIGDGTYATTLQKNLFQVHGFCPTCAATTTTRQQVGTASRTLNSTTQGRFTSQFSLVDGLSGTWSQQDVNWVKLTPDLSCQ